MKSEVERKLKEEIEVKLYDRVREITGGQYVSMCFIVAWYDPKKKEVLCFSTANGPKILADTTRQQFSKKWLNHLKNYVILRESD